MTGGTGTGTMTGGTGTMTGSKYEKQKIKK
jgi:hypothetical protein